MSKLALPTHYVNSAFNFVRTFIIRHLEEISQEKSQHLKEVQAIEKIIDINLDVLTSSYREEELSKFLSLTKVEKTILSGLKKFNSYVNFFLAGALALVAFFCHRAVCVRYLPALFLRHRHRKRDTHGTGKSTGSLGGH